MRTVIRTGIERANFIKPMAQSNRIGGPQSTILGIKSSYAEISRRITMHQNAYLSGIPIIDTSLDLRPVQLGRGQINSPCTASYLQMKTNLDVNTNWRYAVHQSADGVRLSGREPRAAVPVCEDRPNEWTLTISGLRMARPT